jgi:hypothetical protein
MAAGVHSTPNGYKSVEHGSLALSAPQISTPKGGGAIRRTGKIRCKSGHRNRIEKQPFDARTIEGDAITLAQEARKWTSLALTVTSAKRDQILAARQNKNVLGYPDALAIPLSVLRLMYGNAGCQPSPNGLLPAPESKWVRVWTRSQHVLA